MPVSISRSTQPTILALDLNAVAQVDPEAAQIGYALNDSWQGVVDHDGQPLRLAYSELLVGARTLLASGPVAMNVQLALNRLHSYFFGDAAPTPATSALPIPADRSAVVPIGRAGMTDMSVGTWPNSDLIVFESFDDTNMTAARVYLGKAGQTPKPLTLVNAPIVASATTLTLGGKNFLYFAAANDLHSLPLLYRAEMLNGVPGPIESVTVPGVASLMSWPRFTANPDGSVSVAFRDANSVPRWTTSRDGKTFAVATQMAEPGAMAASAAFPSGGFAFSYQQGNGTMTSFVRVSKAGAQWSPPIRITDASDNVHDTTIVARQDGGLDLYYIYTSPTEPYFSLYRRSLSEGGALGAEQRLSTSADGELNKPQVTRKADGSLVVSAVSVTRDASGMIDTQTLVTFSLNSDAP